MPAHLPSARWLIGVTISAPALQLIPKIRVYSQMADKKLNILQWSCMFTVCFN